VKIITEIGMLLEEKSEREREREREVYMEM
jgi:hypothetical protein